MIRSRSLGELITNGDFIVAGEHKFTAIEACLVGQVVRTDRIRVLTYDPAPIDMAALAKNLCFPPKPAKPACACGDVSEYDNDGTYQCRSCFEDARERAL